MIVVKGLSRREVLQFNECVDDAHELATQTAATLGGPYERRILDLAPPWLALNSPSECLRSFDELRAMAQDEYRHELSPIQGRLALAILDRWLAELPPESVFNVDAPAARKAVTVLRSTDFMDVDVVVVRLLKRAERPRFDLHPYLTWLPPETARQVVAALADDTK